jgi:hypothetical protein
MNGKTIYNTYIHRRAYYIFWHLSKKITTIIKKTPTEVQFNSLFTFQQANGRPFTQKLKEKYK